MKTIKTLLAAIAVLLCSISASAHDFEVGGIFYNILSKANKTVEVTFSGTFYDSKANEYTENVTIPQKVEYQGNEYVVTRIGERTFRSCFKLLNVNIPEGVTSIGNSAFEDCTSLASIIIPEGVTRIGSSAFLNCESLTSVTIPNSVTEIESSTFEDCTSLASITIPNGVTRIGSSAFCSCRSLTTIIIPEGVTRIGSDAFRYCSNLKTVYNLSALNFTKDSSDYGYVAYYADKVINVPNGSVVDNYVYGVINSENTLCGYIGEDVELHLPNNFKGESYVIGSSAFENYSKAINVTIPNSVTSIGEYAFRGCTSLASITIPNGVTEMEKNAFLECSKLSKVHISDIIAWCKIKFKERTSNPLYYAHHLYLNGQEVQDLLIPNEIINIEDWTFAGCQGLASVIIHNNVTNIGTGAFGECNIDYLVVGTNVQNIGEYNSTPTKVVWLTNTPPNGYSNLSGTINYVSNENYNNDYRTKVVYKYLSSFFESDGIVYVPVNPSARTCDAISRYGIHSATSITIPEKVNYKNIAMSVNNLMPYACCDWDSLHNVTISCNGEIKYNAFANCSNLTDVTMDGMISTIGSSAFYDCQNLSSIVLSDSIKTINSYAFYNNKHLPKIALPMALESIGESCFSGCDSIAEITIPSNVGSIGNYAFQGCKNLSDVIIEGGDTTLYLGSNGSSPLFADCPLDSVYIGGKLKYSTGKYEGYSPFYRNSTLRSVVVGGKEEEIYDNAFYGCSNLQNVTICNGVKRIGDYAFSGCSGLNSFEFGSSMESIGQEAFSDCTNLSKIVSYASVPPTCGNMALDDINKWECLLQVPKSCLEAYQNAEQWKEFFFIEDVLTGINDVHSDITSASKVNVYSVNGTLIKRNADINELDYILPAGIYIANGKKIVIK